MRYVSFQERFLTGLSSNHLLEFLNAQIWKTAPLRQFIFFIGNDAGHFLYDLSFLCERVSFSDVHFIGFFGRGSFLRKRLDVQLQQQMHHVLFTLQIFVGRRQGENVRS